MTQNFQVFRASAGSGKTYTLALSFIALAIKGDRYGYKDYFKRILAITFTNKAAGEMKESVLDYLETLAKADDKDGILYLEVPDCADFLKQSNPLFLWEQHRWYFTFDSIKSFIAIEILSNLVP